MAEWYQQDADWQEMMLQTQNIVTSIWEKCAVNNQPLTAGKWPIVSYRDLWHQYLHLDLTTLLDDRSMTDFAQSRGYQTAGATWEQLFNQIVFNHIEPHFSASPFFLIDYPSRISPLAMSQTTSPEFAARFELIINRVELANGNTENTNVNSIKTMMETEKQSRSADTKAPPLDTGFLNSLSQLQAHQWAGVGLGLDRLAMLIGGYKSIHDIQWP
jgi:elongation factor P--beta-lysine ligase